MQNSQICLCVTRAGQQAAVQPAPLDRGMSSTGAPWCVTRNTTNFARPARLASFPTDVNVIVPRRRSDRFSHHVVSTTQLRHEGALKHINKRMCVVAMYWIRRTRWIRNRIITPSLPRQSVRSFEKSDVTFASWVSKVTAIRQTSTKTSFAIVITDLAKPTSPRFRSASGYPPLLSPWSDAASSRNASGRVVRHRRGMSVRSLTSMP